MLLRTEDILDIVVRSSVKDLLLLPASRWHFGAVELLKRKLMVLCVYAICSQTSVTRGGEISVISTLEPFGLATWSSLVLLVARQHFWWPGNFQFNFSS